MEAGADAVKLFPASADGPSYVRQVRTVLPQLAIIPTGGMGADEVGAWVAAGAGAVAVGLGSALTAAPDPAAAVRQAIASASEGARP